MIGSVGGTLGLFIGFSCSNVVSFVLYQFGNCLSFFMSRLFGPNRLLHWRQIQDINGSFAFSRCLNGMFPWRKHSIKALVSSLRRQDLYLLLFSFGVIYQCLNGAPLPSRIFIKVSAKCKTSIYVLTEICLQWSKWLGPRST